MSALVDARSCRSARMRRCDASTFKKGIFVGGNRHRTARSFDLVRFHKIYYANSLRKPPIEMSQVSALGSWRSTTALVDSSRPLRGLNEGSNVIRAIALNLFSD